MLDELVIRSATVNDALPLAGLAARTFLETFAADNRPEDMAAYLEATFSVERQTAEMADPATRVLLAEIGGELAGYAQLHVGAAPQCVTVYGAMESIDWLAVELVRFYVDRPWHGRGLAQALMKAVLEQAAALGGRVLWLGVWERNPRAIAFYGKYGFEDVGSHAFQLGSDLQTDRIMVRRVDLMSGG